MYIVHILKIKGHGNWYFLLLNTVNDKSFEGEKFRGLLSSSGMQGKVSQFFPLPPSYIHGFAKQLREFQ